MARAIYTDLDFQGTARITNLPDGTAPQHPATVAQLSAAVEGLAWKDSVRVATNANVNLAAPGASVDGVAMVVGDRFLPMGQTAPAENGIYVWNGAAVPATRSLDANTAAELEQAVAPVEEGTFAGSQFRQTVVNFTLGTSAVTWTNFASSSPPASETTAGIAELATQAETDAGTDDARMVTPLKLKTSPWVTKRFQANVGDGSATQYTVTHNLNTRDVHVEVYRNSGNFDTVLCDVDRPSVNSVRLTFTSAPASNAFRAVVVG